MIIDVLSPSEYKFVLRSLDGIQVIDFTPPGHLVLQFTKSYEDEIDDLLKDTHQWMINDVLEDYPQVIQQFILPYHIMAKWHSIEYDLAGKPISCQNIKNDHSLVYWLDLQKWDCWQCYS